MNIKVKFLLTVSLAGTLIWGLSHADEYYCEVMTLSGRAEVVYAGETSPQELREGDLIKEGDKITVAGGSFVDLAFDKEWNNITRLAEGTQVEVRSIYPTGLAMAKGDAFAKLDRLPKNSTFEIQTPTAVAAVRGSAYRTIHENDQTRVLNYAESPVEVFGLDDKGNLLDSPVILRGNEKTEIADVGQAPREPERMTDDEIRQATEFSRGVAAEAQKAADEGRFGQIQDVDEVSRQYQDKFEKAIEELAKARPDAGGDGALAAGAPDRLAEKVGGKAEHVSDQADKIGEKADNVSEKADRAAEKAEKIADKAEKTVDRIEKEVEDKVEKQKDRKDGKKGGGGSGGGGRLDNIKTD